jgi:predicted O-methyltransferase YrrM
MYTPDFKEQYNLAKKHKDEHTEDGRRCGGEPYKSYDKLFSIVEKFAKERSLDTTISNRKIFVLEIGTAVGFTTYVLQCAVAPYPVGGGLDTIELHQEHINIAKENIGSWGGETKYIDFLLGDAKSILPSLVSKKYDIIFFDGYGIKDYFYKDFSRLLKNGGLLIVANRHLKSSEPAFFEKLKKKEWIFMEEFADTIVYKKMC